MSICKVQSGYCVKHHHVINLTDHDGMISMDIMHISLFTPSNRAVFASFSPHMCVHYAYKSDHTSLIWPISPLYTLYIAYYG